MVGVLGVPIPPEFKDELELLSGVSEVIIITKPYKLASPGNFRPEGTTVRVGDACIGGPDPVIMAGPLLGGRRRTNGVHCQGR